MKISYNWIKEYIYPINCDEIEISKILTNIGLTVKNINKISINNKIDFLFNIETLPNRTDIMSHYGVARDLYAALKFMGFNNINLKKLKTIESNIFYKKNPISIIINKKIKKLIRFSGISIFNLKIHQSPNWLILKLKSLGIQPVNNIIDVINFITYELGIPINLFDLDKIEGKNLFIKKLNKTINLSFEDKKIRKIDKDELIITDNVNIYSLSGILNTKKINLNKKTINLFLGIICFDSDYIFFLKKKYSIQTISQYFFEKVIDSNQIIFVLRRLSFIINCIEKKIQLSNIIDIYPKKNNPLNIKLRYKKIFNTLGSRISKKKIKKILILLNLTIQNEYEEFIILSIPTYRSDLKREIDLIEEILRIYGINNIQGFNHFNRNFFSKKISSYQEEYKIQNIIFEQLTCYGFYEIISSTIRNYNTNEKFINNFIKNENIYILNSIHSNNQIMRSNLLLGLIDCIHYNYNRSIIKNQDIKIFELGKVYYKKNNRFFEKNILGVSVSIKKNLLKSINVYFLYLKGITQQILQRCGINNYQQKSIQKPLLEYCVSIFLDKKELVFIGKVKNALVKNNEIFYAEWNWNDLTNIIQKNKIQYKEFSKYPISIRDLSFFIDEKISFEQLNQSINQNIDPLIQEIKIYDSYKKNRSSKKSYTIKIFFESKKYTLTNELINKSIQKIENFLKEKFNAQIRKKIFK